MVEVDGAAEGGLAAQVTAAVLSGVDQTAAPLLAQALEPGTSEASIGAALTTMAAQSLLVSAFGLGDAVTWSPGGGQALLGYAPSGNSAGGASYRLVGAGAQSVSWSGNPAARPSLILAAYPVVDTGAASASLIPAGRTIAWALRAACRAFMAPPEP